MTSTRTFLSKLNAAERVKAEELGQKIFEWTVRTEEHFAFLRRDPNAYAEAWQEYAAKAPPMGSVPARDKYQEQIQIGEQFLEKKCVTIYDHVAAVNTLALLCRLQLTLAADLGLKIQLAIGEYVSTKSASHQYPPFHFQMPENPHPLLRGAPTPTSSRAGTPTSSSANSPTPSGAHIPPSSRTSTPASSVPPANDYPLALPGQPFSWSDILDYPRKSISPKELASFKRNPEALSGHTFTSTGDMGDKAFRVSCFLTIGKEKLFYLVFADEGADAVAYSSSDFFTLLESSQRVLT